MHVLFENHVAALSAVLGPVHRDVGVPQQRVSIATAAPSVRECQPDARADDVLFVVEIERLTKLRKDVVRDQGAFARCFTPQVFQQDDKLVSA
jgi:hypothetical protein